MDWYILVGIALGLSLDAFAVSVASSACEPGLEPKHGFRMALFFGAFQVLMPLVGWATGRAFSQAVATFDHWIAFGLLLFVGGRMVWEGFKPASPEGVCEDKKDCRHLPTLLMLSVATSLDALAVGVSFAFLNVSIVMPLVVIGAVTFTVCLGGYALGTKLQKSVNWPLEIVGGLVLIAIGTKILVGDLSA